MSRYLDRHFLKTPLLKALVHRKRIQHFQYHVAIHLEHHEKFYRALAQSKRKSFRHFALIIV